MQGTTNSKGSSLFYFAQMALRVFVIAFTLAGSIIMSTSQQSVSMFGTSMDARYTYSASLRFQLVANSTVCGLCVVSVILVILLNRPKSNPKNYFYLFLLDLLSLLVLLSGCSAATAIGYVALFGQDRTGWAAICGQVPKFCHKMTTSIALSFLAVICLLVLTLMSAHKLKSHLH